MSNSELDDGRPFEFTITPMQHVSLGHLKSRDFSTFQLSEAQLAVYYASYRHLAKVATRDAFKNGRNGRNRSIPNLLGTGMLISLRWKGDAPQRRFDMQEAGAKLGKGCELRAGPEKAPSSYDSRDAGLVTFSELFSPVTMKTTDSPMYDE